jgi:fumarate hydratase class II
MGQVEVPSDRYWGAQTQRSLQNFKIGGHRFGRPIIRAFGIVKKAAALTNKDLGKLDAIKCDLITRAADEVIGGKLDAHFPLVVWQTGSGTQSNMNANEVISNRAIELAGGTIGSKNPVHPNDDVNRSQSSNDVFPTVMHVAAALEIEERLLPAVAKMKKAIEDKAKAFEGIVKVGRTHMMDATPLTLGQEFSGWAAQLGFCEAWLKRSLDGLHDLALGGTAVGTGLNTHPRWAEAVAKKIAELAGAPFRTAPNKFAALAGHEALVATSGAMRALAAACFKIASDVRLLGSGPRCGLGELHLPENEPGSSIMPGKVNPVMSEMALQVAAQVVGNDATVAWAAALGSNFELNVMMPVMAFNLLQSIELLSQAARVLVDKCIAGLQADAERCAELVERSLAMCTGLAPAIGYDQAAEIAKESFKTGKTVRAIATEKKLLADADLKKALDPMRMTRPQEDIVGSGAG